MGCALAIVCGLAAAGAAFFAYMEAGGMHGNFQADRLLAGGDASFATFAAVGLTLIAVMLAVAGSKQERSRKARLAEKKRQGKGDP